MGVANIDPVSQLSLPPGFRFYPTDEELLVNYLCRKVAGYQFSLPIIGEVDLYKFDPWILPSKAIFGEKEWYFFNPRDRKYPNGSRPNRVAGSGYWKATGTDKIITTEGRKVGIKKSLVFYVGKAPKGSKTNWIMHEYRLSEPTRKSGSTKLDDWVLCRIYKKNSSTEKPDSSVSSMTTTEHSNVSTTSSSHFDNVIESLPEIDHRFFALPRMNSLKTLQDEKLNIQNSGKFDWNNLSPMSDFPEFVSNGQTQWQADDQYFPSEKFGNSIEDEVESELGSQRVENSSFFQQNSNELTQTSGFLDPFGIRYPTHPAFGSFGYQQ